MNRRVLYSQVYSSSGRQFTREENRMCVHSVDISVLTDLIWYSTQEFTHEKNHMCVQSVVISLLKNLVWYSTQEFTQEKNHMCVQSVVISVLQNLIWYGTQEFTQEKYLRVKSAVISLPTDLTWSDILERCVITSLLTNQIMPITAQHTQKLRLTVIQTHQVSSAH